MKSMSQYYILISPDTTITGSTLVVVVVLPARHSTGQFNLNFKLNHYCIIVSSSSSSSSARGTSTSVASTEVKLQVELLLQVGLTVTASASELADSEPRRFNLKTRVRVG
jgi:hypothetical protein